MKENPARKLVLNGLFIALVFLATYFTRIPTPLPGGYVNLGDAVIMLAAALLGPAGGLIAGAVGSAIADLAAGSLLFAPVTFIVKGIEGLAVGVIITRKQAASSGASDRQGDSGVPSHFRLVLAVAAGAIIMIAGYFLAEAFILGMFDEAFGLAAAASELLPNLLQGVSSAILAYILIIIFSRQRKV
ncbi:MAG: ECF transporter S component [Bacillota bacterium]